MLVGVFSSMKEDLRFLLPGTVAESHNFVRHPNGDVSIALDGAKVVKVMDEVMADDAFLRAAVASPGFRVGGEGFDLPADDLVFMEKLFGEKAPLRVVIAGPFASRFDYASEVKAAKERLPRMMAGLGLELPVVKSTVVSGEPLSGKNFRISAVAMRMPAEGGDGGFFGRKGYTVSVAGDLTEKVLGVRGGVLTTATADTGESLLLEGKDGREIPWSSVRLSEDGICVFFDVPLKTPGPSVRSIREIAGTLDCLVQKGEAVTEDLGFARIAEGAKGKRFGAQIVSLEKFGDGDRMEVAVDLPRETVREIVLTDPMGTRIETEFGGWFSDGTTTRLTVVVDTAIPKDAKVSVTYYPETEVRKVAFSVGNVTVLGVPLK